MSFSFLVGWALKVLVTRFWGGKGYQKVKVAMIGVIAGEVLAGIGFWAGNYIAYEIMDMVWLWYVPW